MMTPGVVRPLCLALAMLAASPYGFGQTPAPAAQPPAPPPGGAAPVPAGPVPEPMVGAPLKITILEGNNAVNSIPLLRSTAPVVEVRDENDFPIEGAAVVFSVPDIGPGGTFATGGVTFSTRTDSHGQAAAPLLVPKVAGRFQIRVAATSGIRKAQISITQINSTSANIEQTTFRKTPWYKRKLVLLAIGGAVAGTIVAIVLTTGGSSGNSGVTITPGTPVFR